MTDPRRRPLRDGRQRCPSLVPWASAALFSALGLPVLATVSTDDTAAPPPTVVALTQQDPLLRLAKDRGINLLPGDLRLEYGTVAFLIAQIGPTPARKDQAVSGTLIDVIQLFPSARRIGLSQVSTHLGDSPERHAVYIKSSLFRTNDLAQVTVEGYDSDDPTIEVKTTYQVGSQLRAGEALRILTTVRNTGQAAVRGYLIGDTLDFGDLTRFVKGAGLMTPAPSQLGRPDGPAGTLDARLPYLLGLGPNGIGLYVPGSALPGAQPVAGTHGRKISHISGTLAALGAGGSATYSRLLVIDKDPYRSFCSGSTAMIGRIPLRGTVQDGAGTPARALLILSTKDKDQAISAAESQEGGRFALCAPAPGEYLLRAEAPGRVLASVPIKLPLPLGTQEPSLTLPEAAHLKITLREAVSGHRPRPATGRITLTSLSGSLSPRALSALGGGVGSLPIVTRDSVSTLVVPQRGEVDLLLPKGRYKVSAQRGLFYDVQTSEVTLREGESQHLQVELKKGIPSSELSGVRCGLLRPLPKSAAEEDLLSLARAESLDYLLSPEVSAIAASSSGIPVIDGAEMVTGNLGRFVVYPLAEGAVLPRSGLTSNLSTVLSALRRLPSVQGAPLAQLAQRGGIRGNTEPDLREIWSGPESADFEPQLSGFLSAVDRGVVVSAVAGVDPRADLSLQAGYLPRTCIGLSQTAKTISPAESMKMALKRGDSLSTNGPFVYVSANGATLGELASAPGGGKVEVVIRAYAPAHVDLTTLEIYGGPMKLAQIPVPKGTTPLRYQGKTTLTLSRDTALVVVARGVRPLHPAAPAVTPLLFTNPIFVDRDGDGQFAKKARQ